MRPKSKTWSFICSLSFLALLALCFQKDLTANDPSHSIKAIKVDHAPALDGTLEDAGWNSATSISEFYQREPFEKQQATEKTEVKVLYDRRYIYFGVRCSDSEPNRIVATELRRDA